MTLHFLHDLPREIRDQIYSYVLASSSGSVTLTPWTPEVARSLSLLQTCHQIHRECKDLVWQDTGLSFGEPSQLYQKFQRMEENRHTRNVRQITVRLELLDRDELEWMAYSLKGLAHWCRAGRLQSIILVTTWERPRNIVEFREVLALRKNGELLDGRLVYGGSRTTTDLILNTGWPRFSHWGKQGGLKAILLDSTGTKGLLLAIHEIFGGELYVDGRLCFKQGHQTATPINLHPQNGTVQIVPAPSFSTKKMTRMIPT